MEEKGGLNRSGITIKGDEVPLSFRVDPRFESTGQLIGGSTAPPTTSVPASMAAAPAAEVKKKKRGRPRKYAADGSIVALSPMPISASIPLTGGDYSGWKSSIKKKQKLEFCNSGQTAYPGRGGFTPHMITINTGEDIMMKIISFSQQGSRAICVLAANGSVSNVTLRQPNSSGGTLTYEGRFEILSLTGSFMPSDNGFTKSRSGGMSISLAGPDGRVLGGGLAGMLVAAAPVQVVIGSFVTGQEHEQKLNKPKYQPHTISFASPVTTNHISEERRDSKSTLPASFRGNNSVPLNSSTHGVKITDPESSSSFPRKDSREQSHELTC